MGLFAYPYGPKISPTTDHAAVGRSLATVLGQRHLPFTQFHLRPAEIVDLSGPASSSQARESPLLEAVIVRECGDVPDDTCRRGLMLDITGAALYYEGQGNAGLGMLRSLLEQLSVINGRKTLVLLSAGMIASDVPGGRPDISELGMQVGKEAARSNTSVYTLFLDTGAHGSSFRPRCEGPTRTCRAWRATARSWGGGSISSPARPAARCSGCRSAAANTRSIGS